MTEFDEMWHELSKKYPKAKKEHQCIECLNTIKKDEKYEKVKCANGKNIKTLKTCLICAEIRNAFFCSWTYEYVLEDLETAIYENNGQIDYECMNELSSEAKNKVFDIIDKAWDRVEEWESLFKKG